MKRRLLRVGHKGADGIVPGNTPASFDAALAHGVDMIELDVLAERNGGRLILAHDYGDAGRRTPFSLEEGLAHLTSPPFESIGLIVDLKWTGYEERVLDALNEHGLQERSIVSTQFKESLQKLRAGLSRVRLGWSVPRARRDYTKSTLLAPPAYAALRLMRIALPRMAGKAVRTGFCDVIVAHWRLTSKRLVAAVERAGGELYVWTVDDAERIRQLDALGVTGVITNDPRLFEEQRARSAAV